MQKLWEVKSLGMCCLCVVARIFEVVAMVENSFAKMKKGCCGREGGAMVVPEKGLAL